MLPGYVAGHYSYDDVHIDLCRLCAATGARFIQAEVISLDRDTRTVQLRGRPDIDYDVVSINTGSTPQPAAHPQRGRESSLCPGASRARRAGALANTRGGSASGPFVQRTRRVV